VFVPILSRRPTVNQGAWSCLLATVCHSSMRRHLIQPNSRKCLLNFEFYFKCFVIPGFVAH
jgi:hypothetical protein